MTEIDAFLNDLDRLAASATPDDPAGFYRQLLPASALALGAGAAEFVRFDAPPETAERWSEAQGVAAPMLEAERLDRLRADGVPRIAPGPDGVPMISCPVEGAAGAVGLLSFLLDRGTNSAERSLELAAAVAEVASRYELRSEGARVSGAEARLARVEEALVRVHSHRAAKPMAKEAAEQGRLMTGCDRLSVLARSGGRWRVLAVSGVSRVSRRSDAARAIERLVQTAMRWGEPLRVPFSTNDAPPPQVVAQADSYCDTTGVRSLRVLPCEAPHDPDNQRPQAEAALLAEWFDETRGPEADPLLAALARHVGVATRRDAGRVTPSRLLNRWATAALVVALLVAAVASSLMIQTPLWVAVDGRFEPIDQARVFAPLDGVVEELLVDQSDTVREGQPLVRLASPELQLRLEEVAEAITATRSELASLETAKLRAALPGRDPDSDDPTVIASRVAAQTERLEHQQRRLELLREQEALLLVTSPIDGRVVSWRPGDLLTDRPVRRGQRLLEIAAGERWRIELEAPDHRSGHVLAAAERGEPLHVEYVVRSNPSQTHRGIVTEVADTTSTSPDGLPVVRVVVAPDDALATNPRSGLGVSAKINCGNHSLAYAWLHEAIEAIRRRWF